MRYVVYDAETHSTVNLTEVGSDVFACDPTTDVWCVSYCIVDGEKRGPIHTWLPSDPVPTEILSAAADPETLIVAFNDAFERRIEEQILNPRYGWPTFPIERRRCAQATVLSYALPAKLDRAAAALQLKVRKTAKGEAAMKKLALPRKPRKSEDPTKIYWHDDPKLFETLYEYNRIDVEITDEIVRLLGFIPSREQEVWQLDAGINARGVCCDVELLDAALSIAEQAATELQEKIAILTGGEITSVNQVDRTLEWLAQHGCALPNIQKKTLREALKRQGLSAAAKQLIELRLDGAHAAVNKLTTMRAYVGADRRIRQAFRYHGAMPGRFTSLGVQLQNLKKPTVPNTAAAIEAVRTGDLAHLQARYAQPLSVVGDITRALIVPASGHQLFIADLSGIESRGLAWLTNEQNKLEQWREFDRSGDPNKEPYYRFGVEELKLADDKARGTGKTCDLAFGYQGRITAWRRLAPADDKTPDEEVCRRQRAWVRRHPNIEKFWTTSTVQARNAIGRPDESFTVARITFISENQFLHMELPSGRRIRYPYARLYENERGKTFTFRDASGGRWEWYHVLKQGRGVFGGLIAENATQALCRDIFVEAMLRLETAGYHIVAHLHDEFICEVPKDLGDLEDFRHIITTPPAWAPDFPIAAKARIADRFIENKKPKVSPAESDDAGAEIASDAPDMDDDAAPAIDIDEINAALQREGIRPIHIGAAAAAATQETPTPGSPPPPPQPNPSSGNSGHGGNGLAGNGFDTGGPSKPFSVGGSKANEPEEPEDTPFNDERLRLQGYQLARVFHYELPDGTKLYEERRYELRAGLVLTKKRPHKQCRFRRIVNSVAYNNTGPRRIIFNWPAIMRAGPGATVHITEGANKSASLNAAGLLATAVAYHKWTPECIEALAGRHLIYHQDHDLDDAKGNNAGRKYANDAREKLLPKAKSFRIVPAAHLFKQFGRKPWPTADVKDWIEAGGEAAKLIEICREIPDEKAGRYVTTKLSTVTPRAVHWIWPGHIARGGLELLAGTPEIGKSQIHCQYIACATTGREWPNGMPGITPCGVVILTAEDTIDDTLVPRLKAAGADLELVYELKAVHRGEREEMFLLAEDLDVLEQMIRDFGDVGLVCIDPITAYMGHGKHFDSHRVTDVRSQLSPLKKLAERTGVAFSAITHPPKNASPRALDHFIGSQAFIAAARVGHLCVAEVEEGEHGVKRATGRRFFTNPKINVGPRQTTLVYRLEVVEIDALDPNSGLPITAPVVRWDGESEITAEEALAAHKPGAKSSRAVQVQDFLVDILTGGPVLQQIVVERGAGHGFSYDQLRRAKKALEVKVFKQKNVADGPWHWALSQHARPEAEEG